MRENFTADWAFGIKGAIENIVRNNFQNEIRNWPILQAFDFEAYALPSDYLVIILKDKLSGIAAGPGIPTLFPYSDLPAIPPRLSDIELWQFYLRKKLSLREVDAPFLIPVHDSGCSSAAEDYKLFTTEEKLFWDHQIKYIIARHYHLKSIEATDNPLNNVFIGCNINGGVDIVNNSKVNKYVHSDAITPASKKWYERPSGILSLGIAASLIAALIWWWYNPYLEKQKTSFKPANESSTTNNLMLPTTSPISATAVSSQDNLLSQREKPISIPSKTKPESKVHKGDELRRFIQELDKEIDQKKLEIANNSGIVIISNDKTNDKSESDLRLEKELERLEAQRTLARQRLIETLAK